jgi:hypothetical protein
MQAQAEDLEVWSILHEDIILRFIFDKYSVMISPGYVVEEKPLFKTTKHELAW